MLDLLNAIYEDCYSILKSQDLERIKKFINNLYIIINKDDIINIFLQNNKLIINFINNKDYLKENVLQAFLPKIYSKIKSNRFCINKSKNITYYAKRECSDESGNCWLVSHPHNEYKLNKNIDGEKLAISVLNEVAEEYFNHNCIKFKIISIDYYSSIYKDNYRTYGNERDIVSTDVKYDISVCFEVDLSECYSYAFINYIKEKLKEILNELNEIKYIKKEDCQEFKICEKYVKYILNKTIISKLTEICSYFSIFRHQPSSSQ